MSLIGVRKTYALFVPSSSDDPTPYATYAADGTTTGMAALSNSILTGAETDFDAGANAVKFEGDQLGSASEEQISLKIVMSFRAARNRVKFKIKVLNQDMTTMWLRLRPTSITSGDICHIDVTNTIVANDEWEATPTLVNIGDGWMQFDGILNFTGDDDVAGQFNMYMGNADNDIDVLNESGDINEIALYQFTFTEL